MNISISSSSISYTSTTSSISSWTEPYDMIWINAYHENQLQYRRPGDQWVLLSSSHFTFVCLLSYVSSIVVLRKFPPPNDFLQLSIEAFLKLGVWQIGTDTELNNLAQNVTDWELKNSVRQTMLQTGNQRTLWNKTSQELRMLSSVTLYCQVTKIVMDLGSQFSEL